MTRTARNRAGRWSWTRATGCDSPGVSDEDIDEINRTRKPLRAVSVRATMSGYVGKKTAITGLHVEPGTELFEITDLSTVAVVADVHESEIELVKAGQKAT